MNALGAVHIVAMCEPLNVRCEIDLPETVIDCAGQIDVCLSHTMRSAMASGCERRSDDVRLPSTGQPEAS